MLKNWSIFLLFIFAFNFTQKQNKFVSTRFKTERIEKDKTVLQIFFAPAPGIHINSQPAPEIVLDNKDIKIVDVKFKTNDKNYIDTEKPILFYLKLDSKNSNVITGKLTYFYCSEKEGWCSKFTEKFEVKLHSY